MKKFFLGLLILGSALFSAPQATAQLAAIVAAQAGPPAAPLPQPTPTLSGTSVTPSVPFTVTTTLDMAVTGFTISSFTVIGSATLSSFVNVDPLTYTVTVTPPANGNITILIPAAAFASASLSQPNLPSNALNFSYSTPPPTEYLTNIYEEWKANRGLNIIPSTPPNYSVYNWTGTQHNYKLLGAGLPSPPVSGVMVMDGTSDYFTLSTSTNPSITGPLTVAFLIKSSATVVKQSTIFDTNTNSPRLQCLLRISSGNTHMGLKYNGTTFDSGADFTYDGALHVLLFEVDGANNVGSIWLDGVQKGSNFALTGGGLNCNTGQLLYVANGQGSPTVQFVSGNIAKARIYTEYMSNVHIGTISTGDFISTTVDTTPTHVVIFSGQSNVAPPTADNHIANYPSNLQNGFSDVYLWQQQSNNYAFIPIPGHVDQLAISGAYPVGLGANLKIAYDLRQKYPTDNIRIIQFYQGATALAVAWDPTVSNGLSSIFLGYINNAMTLLTAEQRTITDVKWLWWQGEGDAAAAPINYSVAVSTTVTNSSTTVTFSGATKPVMLAGMTMTIRGVAYTVQTVNSPTSIDLSTSYAGITETIASASANCSTNSYAFDYAANLDVIDANVRSAVATYSAVTPTSVFVKLTTRAGTAGKEPNWQPVQTAELNKVASNTTIYKLIDTDNLTTDFPLVGGNVHYMVAGLIEAGRRFVLFY